MEQNQTKSTVEKTPEEIAAIKRANLNMIRRVGQRYERMAKLYEEMEGDVDWANPTYKKLKI